MLKLRKLKPVILAKYHNQFLDVIPPEWMQMRNIVLSAVPEDKVFQDPNICYPDFDIR